MKNNRGFSLIELIIVIAILAIIAAIAVPNIVFAIKDARKSTDIANARIIAESIQFIIAEDNEIDRVEFANVEFVEGVEPEDDITNKARVKELIEEAVKNIQGVPKIKNGSLSGSNFNVSIGETTGIIVKAGVEEIYPTPKGDWAN